MAKSISVSIGIDPGRLAEVRRLLSGITFRGRAAADVGVQAAISTTVTTGRAIIARRIGEEIRLRSQDIKDVIKVDRGSHKELEGSITVTGSRVPLIKYLSSAQRNTVVKRLAGNVRGKLCLGRLRISVRRRAQGGYTTSETLPNAFTAVMPRSLHLGIFQRRGKARLPIKELMGPSPLAVLLKAQGTRGAKAIDDVLEDIGEVLEKRLLSQLDRFLK